MQINVRAADLFHQQSLGHNKFKIFAVFCWTFNMESAPRNNIQTFYTISEDLYIYLSFSCLRFFEWFSRNLILIRIEMAPILVMQSALKKAMSGDFPKLHSHCKALYVGGICGFAMLPCDITIALLWRLLIHVAPPSVPVAAKRFPAHPILSA